MQFQIVAAVAFASLISPLPAIAHAPSSGALQPTTTTTQADGQHGERLALTKQMRDWERQREKRAKREKCKATLSEEDKKKFEARKKRTEAERQLDGGKRQNRFCS